MSILSDIDSNTVMPKEALPPTDEQAHYLDLLLGTDDNIMMNALAGTGKTTTLEMGEKRVKVPTILYLVFNTKNAKEAKGRMLSTTDTRTFNGCGHMIWGRTTGTKLTLNTKKCNDILKVIIQESPKKLHKELWDVYFEVLAGVGMAKSLGYIPDGKFPDTQRLCTQEQLIGAMEEQPSDLVIDLVDAVLFASIKAAYAGSVDYNDQVYMPGVFGGAFPRFPLILVDEYQDLNPVNHAMLTRLVKGRIVGVGDPWQNIYGFRGAKANGMAEAKVQYSMTSCDLSVSFRCPEKVVEAARWRVPHFKWLKPGGHVERLEGMEAGDFADGAAVICRNNAPLFKLGMQLLSHGRSVTVAGSDIGPKLIGTMRKLGPEHSPKAFVLGAIEDWRAEKLAKESSTANDMADCMKIFAGYGDDLITAIKYAEHLFAQQGTMKLLTGHKSKGLEFKDVYMLDPWLMKSDDQDLNLRYVTQTRSLNQLFEVSSDTIRWE